MLSFLSLLACTADKPQTATATAVVDINRSEHFFDHPFPSDNLIDENGLLDLEDYPTHGHPAFVNLLQGWRDRINPATTGFGNGSAIYIRFDGTLDLPGATAGEVDDPVILIDLETHDLMPLKLRFTTDTHGDKHLSSGLLSFAPTIGHLPRSGARLAGVVMKSAGAEEPTSGESGVNQAVLDALEGAGVTGVPAVATIFTIQDAVGELQHLGEAVDQWMATADYSNTSFKRVVHIAYEAGTTPSGQAATVFTATFEDGTHEVTYLGEGSIENTNHGYDLLNNWPMAVYQANIPVPNFSGLNDRPYMNPGAAHIADRYRTSGWINFSESELLSTPDSDSTRIVVSLPLNPNGDPIMNAPAVIYDHGTGGHAYNSVQRKNVKDNGLALATEFAGAGYAVIGRDAALYGTRYPLIDEGYGESLGFYNIVNLPAFRDNQRQTAAEGQALYRYMESDLNADLPAGSIDTTRIRRFGHSLGSVTANLGVAMNPDLYESLFLSGTGGHFIDYFLETRLIESISEENLDLIFSLFDAVPPDPVTIPSVLGAAVQVEEEAWDSFDRLHPFSTLFQWIMDPSDPITVAQAETTPTTVFIGIQDFQVPNHTSYALIDALPNATVVTCNATSDYDPHMCLHRESVGYEALRAWLEN